MSHKDVLRRLIPVELQGVMDAELTVEGDQLDLVQADIEAERQIITTDIETLLPPADNRIKMVPVRWDIKKPFYIRLAASLGYEIRIEDYTLAMSDWFCADDELIDGEPWQYFTAGCAMSGDTLAMENTVTPWIWEVVVIAQPEIAPTPDLETVLNDLEPAHVQLNFTYL